MLEGFARSGGATERRDRREIKWRSGGDATGIDWVSPARHTRVCTVLASFDPRDRVGANRRAGRRSARACGGEIGIRRGGIRGRPGLLTNARRAPAFALKHVLIDGINLLTHGEAPRLARDVVDGGCEHLRGPRYRAFTVH